MGRLVGFEGDGAAIISMHQLKPDSAARRGCEITVFRMGHDAFAAILLFAAGLYVLSQVRERYGEWQKMIV